MNFATTSILTDYAASPNFGTSQSSPAICFGIAFNQIDTYNYNYSLLYFDASQDNREGNKDIPNQSLSSLNPFKYGPDPVAYRKWIISGYLEMMTIINNMILQMTTGNSKMQINSVIAAQKYLSYKNDPFARAIGFILPFFLVIAYICPLCVIVFRIVSDKVNLFINLGNKSQRRNEDYGSF